MAKAYLVPTALAILSIIPLEMPGHTSALKVPTRPGSTEAPQKFENGLQIFWRNEDFAMGPGQPASNLDSTVGVFDPSRKIMVSCNLTKVIHEADSKSTDVSVYDVSARYPGYIAVSAVYARTAGTPIALLLYFGWDGSLIRSVVLDQLPQIDKLEIDHSGHLWALNDFDTNDPAEFVFEEFDSSASLLNRFVKPKSHWSTQESMSTGGEVSFGLTTTEVWAWLPKSRTLISVDKSTGRGTIYNTGLPRVSSNSYVNARKAVLFQNGELLMDAGWRKGSKFESQWFLWKAGSGWKSVRVNPGDPSPYLYGFDEGDLIFISNPQPSLPPEFHAEPASALLAAALDH